MPVSYCSQYTGCLSISTLLHCGWPPFDLITSSTPSHPSAIHHGTGTSPEPLSKRHSYIFKFCFILLQTVFAFFTFIWFFLLHLSQLLHLCAVFVLTSKAPRFTLVILKSATLIRTVDSEVRMFIKQRAVRHLGCSPPLQHIFAQSLLHLY